MKSTFKSIWENQLDFLDVHYHASPDVYLRKHTVIETGRIYQKLKGGVILKNHMGDSVSYATIAQELSLPVFGSVVLNQITGGPCLNSLIESLCKMRTEINGRLLVHLPTLVKTSHQSVLNRTFSNDYIIKYYNKPCSITDSNGVLKKEVVDLLYAAQELPIVISTGHSSYKEIMTLLETCSKLGKIKIMLNQPANPIVGMKYSDLIGFSKENWIYVEQTSLTYLLKYQEWDDFSQVLTELPNLIYSSDLGQINQPDVNEWLEMSKDWFRELGLSSERIKDIMLLNPLKMLTI